MLKVTLQHIIEIVNGKPFAIKQPDLVVKNVVIDSRKVEENTLFIALKGERFDGHDFAEEVIKQGAAALIVEKSINKNLPHILVDDSQEAMAKIAHWLRKQSAAKFMALTGSSGKTSVKEMSAAILKQMGKTHYTQGNFNNNIGVPLTLFALNEDAQFAVIELGANHKGEIDYTTHIVEPDIALVNNVGAAHIEGFGSIEGVAEAKGEIYSGLPDGGIAIINLDSYSEKWLQNLSSQKVYRFALSNPEADFYASEIQLGSVTRFTLNTPMGTVPIELPLLGEHNVSNVVAASALTISAGASLGAIQKGILSLKPVKGRLYPIKLNKKQWIIDDCYNANVSSMKAAIQVLASQAGTKIFVVGDMGELGEKSIEFHKEVGVAAKNASLDYVLSVGNLSEQISQESGVGIHFATKNELAEWIHKKLSEDESITLLVKGSRSAKMEEVIDMVMAKEGKDKVC